MLDDFEIIHHVKQNLPFKGEIPKNLKAGDVLSIFGYVLPHCIRFAINLTCNKNPNADVGFHFNPRLSPRYIARNSRINGIWGEEESTSIAKFDIPRSTRILIEILFTEYTFEVCINGKHFCAYAYRIPLSTLKYLEVSGALLVEDISYRKVAVFPEHLQLNENFHHLPIIKEAVYDLCNCSDMDAINTPFLGSVPRGLPNTYKLEIHGRTKLLPHIFYVNLQVGRHIWPHPPIALHLNPRFNTVFGENLLIKNSFTHGKWGNEERSPVFPFAPGEHFKITIQRETKHYEIWINDKLNSEYRYRNNEVEEVDTVYIQGDLILYKTFLLDTSLETDRDSESDLVLKRDANLLNLNLGS